jgi:hypothetical protein
LQSLAHIDKRREIRLAFKILLDLKSQNKLPQRENNAPVIQAAINDSDIIPEQNRAELSELFAIISSTSIYTPLVAIGHHISLIHHVWLMVSEQAKKQTLPIFHQTVTFLFGDKLDIINNMHTEDIPDPNNISAVSRIVNSIYHKAEAYDLEENDVTCDITAGTASMSAGMILGCVRKQRKVQYLRQDSFKLNQIYVMATDIPGVLEELMEQYEYFETQK